MEQPNSTEQKEFEHGVDNTRLESQPNELLARVKEQVLAQVKARHERGTEHAKTPVSV
jgi:hypothetical protein